MKQIGKDHAKEQVFMGLELAATALNLSDKLQKQPSGIDWMNVAVGIATEWNDSVNFEAMVKNEPELMVFLKEQLIFYSRDYI